MWTKDGVTFRTHDDIRRSLTSVLLPANLTDAIIEGLGFQRVTPGNIPAYNPLTHVLLESAPVQIEGEWVTVFTTREKAPEELQAMREGMVVEMRQARLVMLDNGLLDQVSTAFATLSPEDQARVNIYWEYDTTVRRLSPWIVQLGPALGLSEAQLDQLFAAASTL